MHAALCSDVCRDENGSDSIQFLALFFGNKKCGSEYFFQKVSKTETNLEYFFLLGNEYGNTTIRLKLELVKNFPETNLKQ